MKKRKEDDDFIKIIKEFQDTISLMLIESKKNQKAEKIYLNSIMEILKSDSIKSSQSSAVEGIKLKEKVNLMIV